MTELAKLIPLHADEDIELSTPHQLHASTHHSQNHRDSHSDSAAPSPSHHNLSPRKEVSASHHLNSFNTGDENEWKRRMEKVATAKYRSPSASQRNSVMSPSTNLHAASQLRSEAVLGNASDTLSAQNEKSANSQGYTRTNVTAIMGSSKQAAMHPHHRSASTVDDWLPVEVQNSHRTLATKYASHSPKSQLHSHREFLVKKDNFMHEPPQPSTWAHLPPVGCLVEGHKSFFASIPCFVSLHHWHLHLQAKATSKRILAYLDSPGSMVFFILITIFALFAHDFTLAFLPKTADLPVSIVLAFIFAVYLVDIVLQSLLREHYFLSLYFLLDLLGTVSLLFEMNFVAEKWGVQELIDGGMHGVQGQVGRSANIIRLAQFTRVLRIVRFVRILRMLQIPPIGGKQVHASKVGYHLGEVIDKRILLMTLILLIALPFFTADMEEMYGVSEDLGLKSIQLANSTTERDDLFQRYLYWHDGLVFLLIQPNNDVLYYRPNIIDDTRSSQILTYTFTAYSGSPPTLATSIAQMDVSSVYISRSIFNMILTIAVIVGLLVISIVITRDIHKVVVAPLDRMTAIIRKLTGTICFMNAEVSETHSSLAHPSKSSRHHQHKGSMSEEDFETTYETRVVEDMVERLGDIFALQPMAGGNKTLQMMAGSKHTEINTGSTVLSIDVKEEPRLSPVTAEELAESEDDSLPHINVDTSVHTELATIDSIMTSETIVPFFKLYLTSALSLEHLLFYTEIDRFKAIFATHAVRLFEAFVSTESISQINIPATMHDDIKLMLPNPVIGMFDLAQAECVGLLKAHLRGFLISKYAEAYLISKFAKGTTPLRSVHYADKVKSLNATHREQEEKTLNAIVRETRATLGKPEHSSNATLEGTADENFSPFAPMLTENEASSEK